MKIKPGPLLTIARGGLAASIFACSALSIEYQNSASGFCGPSGGCADVRASSVGQAIEHAIQRVVPNGTLPQIALFAFVGMLSFTFFLKNRKHLVVAGVLGGIGGIFAAALIAAQFVVGHFCEFCFIVDLGMIAAAAALLALARVAREEERARAAEKGRSRVVDASLDGRWFAHLTSTPLTLVWGATGALMAVIPYVWGAFAQNGVGMPPPIAALQEPGKTVIVTFTDFQCPHCRKVFPTLKELESRPNVVLKRFMVPLAMHPGAKPAAQAYLCAPEDKRETMAEVLYTAPSEQLTTEGVLALADGLAVGDLDAFKTCMTSDATKKKIEDDTNFFFDTLKGEGLPTTYVGRIKVGGASVKEGEKFDQRIIDAFEKGKAPSIYLPVWAMFVAASVVLIASLGVSFRFFVPWSGAIPLPPQPKSRRARDEDEPEADEEADEDSDEEGEEDERDDESEDRDSEPESEPPPAPKKKAGGKKKPAG
ncbi:MAG: thioredoxin domain-containing protein [Polyangiaceae bacterium]